MSIIRDLVENQRTTTPTKVGDAIGVNEAATLGQLTSPPPIPGSNADLVDGVQGALLGVGGQGYAWVDETANRVVGTTYINTYGKPIMVALNLTSTDATAISLTIDSISIWSNYQSSTGSRISIEGAIIPNGSTYILNVTTGTPTLLSWSELK